MEKMKEINKTLSNGTVIKAEIFNAGYCHPSRPEYYCVCMVKVLIPTDETRMWIPLELQFGEKIIFFDSPLHNTWGVIDEESHMRYKTIEIRGQTFNKALENSVERVNHEFNSLEKLVEERQEFIKNSYNEDRIK